MAARETVFHQNALLDLADQLGSTIARSYALTFLEMLQARVERILNAIGNNDVEDAMDALLSLKVNAQMVGASSMAQVCTCLEQSVLDGAMPIAARNALALPGTVTPLTTAITEFLGSTRNGVEFGQSSESTAPEPERPGKPGI